MSSARDSDDDVGDGDGDNVGETPDIKIEPVSDSDDNDRSWDKDKDCVSYCPLQVKIDKIKADSDSDSHDGLEHTLAKATLDKHEQDDINQIVKDGNNSESEYEALIKITNASRLRKKKKMEGLTVNEEEALRIIWKHDRKRRLQTRHQAKLKPKSKNGNRPPESTSKSKKSSPVDNTKNKSRSSRANNKRVRIRTNTSTSVDQVTEQTPKKQSDDRPCKLSERQLRMRRREGVITPEEMEQLREIWRLSIEKRRAKSGAEELKNSSVAKGAEENNAELKIRTPTEITPLMINGVTVSEKSLRKKKKEGTITAEEDEILRCHYREQKRQQRERIRETGTNTPLKEKVKKSGDIVPKKSGKHKSLNEQEREKRLAKRRQANRRLFHSMTPEQKEALRQKRRLWKTKLTEDQKRERKHKQQMKRAMMTDEEKQVQRFKSLVSRIEKMQKMTPEELELKKAKRRLYLQSKRLQAPPSDEVLAKRQAYGKNWRKSWTEEKKAQHNAYIRQKYHEKVGALTNNPKKWEEAKRKYEEAEQLRIKRGIPKAQSLRYLPLSQDEKKQKQRERTNLIRRMQRNAGVIMPVRANLRKLVESGMTPWQARYYLETPQQRERRLRNCRVSSAKRKLRKRLKQGGTPPAEIHSQLEEFEKTFSGGMSRDKPYTAVKPVPNKISQEKATAKEFESESNQPEDVCNTSLVNYHAFQPIVQKDISLPQPEQHPPHPIQYSSSSSQQSDPIPNTIHHQTVFPTNAPSHNSVEPNTDYTDGNHKCESESQVTPHPQMKFVPTTKSFFQPHVIVLQQLQPFQNMDTFTYSFTLPEVEKIETPPKKKPGRPLGWRKKVASDNNLSPVNKSDLSRNPRPKLPKDAVCELCGKQCIPTLIHMHKRYNHNPHWENSTCTICNIEFSNVFKFDKHYISIHGDIFPKVTVSKRAARKEAALSQPRIVLLETQVCDHCGKTISKSNFRAHVHFYHGDGANPDNFKQCPHCPARFRLIQSLKNHCKNRHNDAQFLEVRKCSRCANVQFQKMSDLKKHVEEMHPHEYFPCTYCDVFRYTIRSLKCHIIRCKSGPQNLSAVIDERLINVTSTDRLPLQCELCPNVICLRSLTRHYKLVHGITEDKMKCFQCNQWFKDRMFLVDHLDYAHGVLLESVEKEVAKFYVLDRNSEKMQNIIANIKPVKFRKQRTLKNKICEPEKVKKVKGKLAVKKSSLENDLGLEDKPKLKCKRRRRMRLKSKPSSKTCITELSESEDNDSLPIQRKFTKARAQKTIREKEEESVTIKVEVEASSESDNSENYDDTWEPSTKCDNDNTDNVTSKRLRIIRSQASRSKTGYTLEKSPCRT